MNLLLKEKGGKEKRIATGRKRHSGQNKEEQKMNSNMQTNTEPTQNLLLIAIGRVLEERKEGRGAKRKEERGKREEGSYSFIKSKFKDFSMFKG